MPALAAVVARAVADAAAERERFPAALVDSLLHLHRARAQLEHTPLAELGERSRGKPTTAWEPWRLDGTPLGYWQSWERLTYATVKGAGHMAPTNQPLSTFEMLHRWLGQDSLADPADVAARRR